MVQYRHNSPYYELHLSELDDDAVRVLAFEGIENISRLFKYSFQLLSENAELNAEEILNKKATFIMNRGDEDPLTITGIISRFEQRGQSPDYVSYYAELVPKMWRLGLTFQSRIFQNMDIEKMVTEVLETSELSSDDFEFQLNETYPELEFAVQYRESDFDFINRRLEHFGIYYYFEHRDENDVIVFTDSNDNLPQIDSGEDVLYNPNKDPLSEIETVSQFIYQGQVVTGKTQLKDYNYREPSKDLLSESEIESDKPGTYSNYGDHYKDENEGQFLARVRNEEIVCNSVNYKGKSDCRLFHAGYKFTMGQHFREDWNTDYLLTHVLTRGNQRGLFGILQPSGKIEPTFENYFEALPPDIIFRPGRLTLQPKIHGILNAKVDATGDAEHTEVDDQGRYKVILPFDLSGKSDGEASHYIRMIQPYAGPNFGMHFPLHKDTEVLLTFIDGNPDRPIISGAVPNPETISPVTNENQTKSVIRDNYGNEIVMDTTPGDEHMRLYSPHHNSGLELGRSVAEWTASDKDLITGGNAFSLGLGMKTDLYAGYKNDFLLGSRNKSTFGLSSALTMGINADLKFGHNFEWNYAKKSTNTKEDKTEYAAKDVLFLSGEDHVLGAGDQMCLVGGASEKDDGRSIVNLFPKKIMLTTGGNKVNMLKAIGPVQSEGQLYEEFIPKSNKWRDHVAFLVSFTVLSSSIVSLIWGVAKQDNVSGTSDIKKSLTLLTDITLSAGLVMNLFVELLLPAYSIYKTGKKLKKEAEVDKSLPRGIEPVEHFEPSAKIEMDNNGKIMINSNKGDIKLQVVDENKNDIAHIYLNSGRNNLPGIFLQSNKSQLHLRETGECGLYGSSDIITSSGRTVYVEAEENVEIQAKKDVKIQAKGNVKIQGRFVTPNIDVQI